MDFLKARKQAAFQELAKIIKDKNKVPVNYNHYYTDTVHKKRVERAESQAGNTTADGKPSGSGSKEPDSDTAESSDEAIRNMEAFSCEEALDCLNAIYKVCGYPKTQKR